MENSNPLSQLPQLLEAMLARIEAMLAEQNLDPSRREPTELLLKRLRRQSAAMRALAKEGEGLTEEQAASIAKVPVPQVGLFPTWVSKRKEGK